MRAVDVHDAPDVDRARATVVIRTPYGRRSAPVRAWCGRGMRVVAADVAGRYDADGDWLPYGAHEADDGAALVRTMATTLPDACPIVLAGASYEAFAALEAERALLERGGPNPVAAAVVMVPALGLWETAHGRDGTPQYMHRVGWWAQHGFDRTPRPRPSADEIRARLRVMAADGMEAAFADEAEPARDGWRRLWQAAPRDVSCWAHPSAAPLLVVTGAHCPMRDHALHLAQTLHGHGRRVSLLDGPWGHGLMADLSPDTPLGRAVRAHGGLFAQVQEWLDGALTGRATSGVCTVLDGAGARTSPLGVEAPRREPETRRDDG